MACVVRNCKSHRGIKGTHGKNISFHRFPTDEVFLNQWIDAVDLEPDWTPKNYHTVCSEHFTPDCFTNICSYRKHRKLTESAVPTLNLPQQPYKKKDQTPNTGAYPTMVIVPLTPKCTEPSLTPYLRSSAKTETFNLPKPLVAIDKTDCSQCLQYRDQIQILKNKVEHLEQAARKRFSKIKALRQKAMSLELHNRELYKYIENKGGKKMVIESNKKRRRNIERSTMKCDDLLLVVKEEDSL
ncbi:THAP domain-containing protein 1-like isoform X2 [Maniola jurtina]|uniref:THAP domain-containing protein 1-like isoform X2 n=1 Tax=Maniola jurtina TaxID=191418 RepID=UPI001E68AA7B|nr:THAP domain-containing protein 1-like isoform X2 [Maniola jurtina]